jgi:beta-lactamase class A
MGSYHNLSLKSRQAKRRRQKRLRLLAMFILIMLITFAGSLERLSVENLRHALNGFMGDYQDNIKQVLRLGRPYKKESTSYLYEIDNTEDSSNRSIAAISRVQNIANINNDMQLDALKKDIENYINNFEGRYGIYYINLVDNGEFGINDKDEYIAASTVKIPINLYLYNKIKDGSINPDGTMPYLKEDYEGGTGKLQFDKIGNRYTVRELSRLSIELSDNVATNILLRLLGRYNVKKFMRDLGGIVVSDERNISCPRDMALYMEQLYIFCKSSGDIGKELMGYFQNTVFMDRIPKLLPRSVKIAHKTGNQTDAYHDVGIVFAKKPYVIAIMSEDIENQEEAYNVIAKISKKVYDFVSKK